MEWSSNWGLAPPTLVLGKYISLQNSWRFNSGLLPKISKELSEYGTADNKFKPIVLDYA